VRIQAIIETAIYVDDLQAAATFYGTILFEGMACSSDSLYRHRIAERPGQEYNWGEPT